MKRPPRMAGQPGAHLGMLVGGVVVEDRVHQLSGRHGGLDAVQKADELLVAMTRHALADHCAIKDIERRKQRGRASMSRRRIKFTLTRKEDECFRTVHAYDLSTCVS